MLIVKSITINVLGAISTAMMRIKTSTSTMENPINEVLSIDLIRESASAI